MNRPQSHLLLATSIFACLLQAVAGAADEFLLDGSQPACGKVCKLVCETKKLTAICYGSESKDICIPDPSREGCKHCAVCYGKCAAGSCGECQPKCQFCWRDWFACGCAQPRRVRVLTKYQAEKKICWYHWEVVDATCCKCVSQNGHTSAMEKNTVTKSSRTIYKPAPEDARLGDVLPVSEEEWVRLAAVLEPDPTEVETGAAADSSAKSAKDGHDEAISPGPESKPASLAERLERLWNK